MTPNLCSHSTPAWAFDFPWDPATLPEENYQVATIGQVKFIFSFDLTSFSITDINTDHIPDIWASLHATGGGGSGAEEDFDGDNMSNAWEFKYGMDPANSDQNDNDILDSFDDFDGDGIYNDEEAAFNMNPYSTDTDGDSLPDEWELENDFNPTVADDASGDRNGDGITEGQAAASGWGANIGLAGEWNRKVLLFTRQIFEQKTEGGNWNQVSTSAWERHTWIGAPSAQAPKVTGTLWGLAFMEDASYRWRGEFYFLNSGGLNPVKIHWTQYEYENDYPSSDNLKTLSDHTADLEALDVSETYTIPAPANPGEAAGIQSIEVTNAIAENGFDNYERYAPPGQPAGVLEQPWQMVPLGQPQNKEKKVQVELNATYLFSPPHIRTSGAGRFKFRDSNGQVVDHLELSLGSSSITLEAEGEGEDAYMEIYGQDASTNVKILHVSCLPKITYVVQAYVVTLHAILPNKSKYYPSGPHDCVPKDIPSESKLEEALNEVYEEQMNVHFTVLPYIPLGPMDYDIGAGVDLQSRYPDLNGNMSLDIVDQQDTITAEENSLYGQVNGYNPNVINIYFLPANLTDIMADSITSHWGNGVFYYTGLSRYKKKAAFIAGTWGDHESPAVALAHTAILKKIVAHEIGHLGMQSVNGTDLVLKHPREGGSQNQAGFPNVDPGNLFGFPLYRLSDDRSRLMWPYYNESTGNALIHDEWMKFRASKPPLP